MLNIHATNIRFIPGKPVASLSEKKSFCGIRRITISICDAVSGFNKSTKGRGTTYSWN